MHAVARVLDQLDSHDRDLYLFDTFEGMSEPTDKDVRFDGQKAPRCCRSSTRRPRCGPTPP
jgi:hypothetical protein